MELASSIARAADRLGLQIRWTPTSIEVRRHGWRAQVNAHDLMAEKASRRHHIDGAWLLLGLRLGLDKRQPQDSAQQDQHSPLRFRRTALRRYQEAPSVHGEHLPLLVPSITREVFETVAEETAFSRPWILSQSDLLILHQTGKRLDILTVEEARDSEDSESRRWERVRAALFYESYKVRPREEIAVDGGRLRIFRSTEGLTSSRALLLPEFDYDASQDGGLVAIPTRDCLIIARPEHPQEVNAMLPSLRHKIHDVQEDNVFSFTDGIFRLSSDDIQLLKQPTFICGESAATIHERIGTVEPVLQT